MSPDGRHWAQYTPLAGRRMEGEEHCNMGLNCCIASGPRGLFTLPHTTVMSAANGISINFFVDGVYESVSPKKQKLTVNQQTQYPRNGNIIAKISLTKPEQFELRIRIPQWSLNTTMKVNGEPITGITAGEFKKVTRTWKNGDEIELTFDMNTRLQTLGKNPSYVAFMRGPVLFARDTRLGGPELAAVLRPVKTKEGGFILTDTISGKKDVWMEVKGLFAPESYPENREKPMQISLCDYASAGNGAETSYFVVWMAQLVDARQTRQ
jgi:DUF1680 family protein